MSGKRLIAAALAVAILQIGFLSWIIAGRAAILRNGQEVLLKVEPVDPRDLLRGDYVVLGYEISNIPVKLIANIPEGKQSSDEQSLVVRVKKGIDGYWHPETAWLDAAPVPTGTDEVDIVGRIGPGWDLRESATTTVSPYYGIERFYLPEGEGQAIQNDMRVRPFGVKMAVTKNGKAQIKALMDGDTMLFEEPLY
ncbi:GDYXXLXY domain-containing protein [Ollibium composti]|uniref:GDYXXLXY domain-containing protein n=1 Tax=Ollibium composti TaxID=2675109 RepID=A0ABY2QBK7_9HYPH|nr:GDYXXLXY domain-containing protein [Mesorhizobium composti]THF58239.1 hypothetical protein E6C48_06385 [Mesorhizobium composti]